MYVYIYRIDLLLSILSYVHIVYFHSLFLKSVSKRWHIHDILRNITSFHLNWCVSWGSWPISLPWISIPERWQIELTMFFCRFAVNSFWRIFFPLELLSWLRWFKRWHDRCQYHLYSWTRIVIQKLSHIFDCVSLALAVLGTEILYLSIYIFI